YERGVNRMSASRLFEFARVLNVSVYYFFEGFDEQQPATGPVYRAKSGQDTGGVAETPGGDFEYEQVFTRESLELMRCFHKLKSPLVKRRVVELVRAVAEDKAVLEEA